MHCPGCDGKAVGPYLPHVGVSLKDCPGCGHDEDVVTFDPQRGNYRPVAERITALEAKRAKARATVERVMAAERTEQARLINERDTLKAMLEQAREVLQRCLMRLKAEREMVNGTEVTSKLDPRVHGMDVLIPLLEAALSTAGD